MVNDINYMALEVSQIDMFTPAECSEIIKIGKSKNMAMASIAGEKDKPSEKHVRQSKVSWLTPNLWDTNWLYRRIVERTKVINDQYYKFDISGVQPLQFTEYDCNYEGHYNWHFDGMREESSDKVRKLSLAIPLSPNTDYEGGDFVVRGSDGAETALQQSPGTAIVFPSFTLHKVNPVTKGKRYSLVAWLVGPEFR